MVFFHRRLSTSSTCSASSDEHYNDRRHNSTARPRMTYTSSSSNPSSRRQSAASERSCEGLTAGDCKELWRCMLELQEAYNCYHSTRIDLAIDAGDAGVSLMPNRFIIDTLNESVIDLLPEEGWNKLDRCLRRGSGACREIH